MADRQKVFDALAQLDETILEIERTPGRHSRPMGMAPSLASQVRSLYHQLREAAESGDKARVCKVSTQIFGALVGFTMPPFSVVLAIVAVIAGEYACPALGERTKA